MLADLWRPRDQRFVKALLQLGRQHFFAGSTARLRDQLRRDLFRALNTCAQHLEIFFRTGTSFPDIFDQQARSRDNLNQVV